MPGEAGAAFSADPGEGAGVEEDAPASHLTGGGDPAEGGAAEGDAFRAEQAGARPGPMASPSDHLSRAGDPVEGRR